MNADGRPDIAGREFAVPFKLGKIPAETEKVGIVLMFKVGKGRTEG